VCPTRGIMLGSRAHSPQVDVPGTWDSCLVSWAADRGIVFLSCVVDLWAVRPGLAWLSAARPALWAGAEYWLLETACPPCWPPAEYWRRVCAGLDEDMNCMCVL
jgi:hypothetical protein